MTNKLQQEVAKAIATAGAGSRIEELTLEAEFGLWDREAFDAIEVMDKHNQELVDALEAAVGHLQSIGPRIKYSEAANPIVLEQMSVDYVLGILTTTLANHKKMRGE